MRGSETAQYVDNIMQRHSQYRLALATGAKVKVPVNVPVPVDASTASPHRAAKKNKWRKD
jgi:hypothetical protein